jgi:hypothetical protein
MSAVKPLSKKASSDNNVHRSKVAEDSTQASKKVAKKSSEQDTLQPAPYLQTKLSVSTPGDTHEQEADRVADEVVSRSPANNSTSCETVNPGNSQPEKTLGNTQSLQTKISRLPDESIAKMHDVASDATTESSAPETANPENENGVSDEVEQQIESLKGQGSQLPDDVRTEMESQFSHDFSSVCIHNDAAADALCKQLSARAFTVGSDIFFASGEYTPTTQEGKRLLAHELTHVVQQGRGVTRKIMRDETSSAEPIDDNEFNVNIPASTNVSAMVANIRINSVSDITVDKIALPGFKIPFHPAPITYRPNTTPRAERGDEDNQQRNQWQTELSGSTGIVENTQNQIITQLGVTPNGSDTYVFSASRTDKPPMYFIGNIGSIRNELTIPAWTKNRASPTADNYYQVDHKKELQLGGDNTINNYWLLFSSTNQASGRKIRNFLQVLTSKIGDHEELAAERNRRDERPNLRNSTTILANCTITFNSAVVNTTYDRTDPVLPNRYFWNPEEVSSGMHLTVLDDNFTVRNFDSLANPGNVMIMGTQNRSTGTQFRVSSNVTSNERDWMNPWEVTSKVFWTEDTSITNPNLGQLGIRLNRRTNETLEQLEDSTLTIKRYPGSRYVGYPEMDRYFMQEYGKYAVKHCSPITIDTVNFDVGSVDLRGRVHPTLNFISGCDLDFKIANGAIEVSKSFAISDLSIPPPFSIDESTLSLFISSQRGLGIEGKVDFCIDRVGKGFVEAALSTGEGIALGGEFNFDDRIFGEGTNAQVRIGYRDNQWSMGGTITIPEGKVPGIQTATINVDYSQESGFHAEGTATLNVPGVESGTIEITNNDEEGFVIGGSFNLSQGRGIRGGQISARVQEKPDGSGYAVSAHGEAQPDIPGINSNLIVDYNDGAFTAEVTADYSRGMLSGQIHAGVTNRTVNADGTLAETAAENNELVVFGDGELTIQIAPWLQGTAGVRFDPNGEITVIGRIGLPDELEIFARREINRSIFNIAVQAPIFPGIVAEVGGGLSATAGIGPGVIDQLTLQIEYNPAHEEDTHITGDAHLNIPANAGLRLNVRAGIGLGITGASATGGLDIGGTLGIEGAAEAGVHVDWTPATGLDITAELAVHAQPSFTFDIGGYVSVRALGFEVYDNRWEFASYTFGSDYRFGIRLPIHYHEGEPFDISTDDIVFEVPDIDTDQLLSGLIERIA